MRAALAAHFFAFVFVTACPPACAAQFAYVANYSGNTVSVIDTATNAVVGTIPVGIGPWVLAVNPTGTFVYVGHSDPLLGAGSLDVIDTATNTVVATLLSLGAVRQIVVNDAGTRVYVLNGSVTFGTYGVSVVDASTNTILATIPTGPPGGGIILNPALPVGYIASTGIHVFDTLSNTVVITIPFATIETTKIAVNATGTRLYVPNGSLHSVSVVDTGSYSAVATVPVGLVPRAVAMNPAGTHAYVTNWLGGSLSVLDTVTNTVLSTIALGPGSPIDVFVNPAGSPVYVLQSHVGPSTMALIDATTDAVIANLPAGAVALNPAGTMMNVADAADGISVRNGSTGALIAVIPLGFSPIAVVVGPEISTPPPIVTDDTVVSSPGTIGNTFNIAANDPRLPTGATFAVTDSTCPAPAPSVSAAGVVTYTAPSAAGATCTLTIQVCAPAPDESTCSIESLRITAGLVNVVTSVPTMSEWTMGALAILLIVFARRHLANASRDRSRFN